MKHVNKQEPLGVQLYTLKKIRKVKTLVAFTHAISKEPLGVHKMKNEKI